MEFDMPKEMSSIIKVIGVGGGGSNAVNHMYGLGIKGVDFVVCNTDKQSLDISPVPLKIQLGAELTEGRGAGSLPEVGREAAVENMDELRAILSKDTRMIFVTAGMGGGTGTGAAPVVAQIAKEMGILTVGIVTVPFAFEGRKRRIQAEEGLEQIRGYVDTLLVINNEKLREISGNLSISEAFAKADSVLSTAAKSIADVISSTGAINVDFNDVKTVMKDSGVAIMGAGIAEGENRAIECVEAALQSPLLNDNDITGANYVLLNITYGDKEVTMDEISEITDFIQDQAGNTAEVIFGHGYDPTLGSQLSVTLIATGFDKKPLSDYERTPQKTKVVLEAPKEEIKNEAVAPKVVETPPAVNSDFSMYVKSVETTTPEVTSGVPTFDSIKAMEDARAVEEKTVSNQFVFELEVTEESKPESTVIVYDLDGTVSEETTIESVAERRTTVTSDDTAKLSHERLEEIRRYTASLKTSDGLSRFESEPAYKRKNIELENSVFSKESYASRISISNEENGSSFNNNSFLHDNVD